MKKILLILLVGLLTYGLYLAEQKNQVLTKSMEKFSETSVGETITGWFQSASGIGAEIAGQIDLEPVRQAIEYGANLLPIDGEGQLADPVQELQEPENTGDSLSFPAEFNPYRTMLSADGKALYNQIYANALVLNAQFRPVVSISTEEVDQVVSALLFDHAELFWVDYSYRYAYLKDGSVVSLTLSFNQTAEDLATNKQHFNQAAQSVLQQAKGLDTVEEQEQFVHDYLLDHVEYDLDSKLNQSAYSALVNGESVCAGYSRAFQYLMTELGIPCYYCVGDADGNHAWNIISLDDGYYHVDVSWDDSAGTPSGSYNYSYYNLTDAEIAANHSRTGLSVGLPACDGPALSGSKPAGTVQSSGLLTYEEAGFTKADLLYTLGDYYDSCRQTLIDHGTGTCTIRFLLGNQALQQAIYDSAESKAYVEGYLNDVVDALGLAGCSAQIQLSAVQLSDGFYELTQKVTLQAMEQEQPLSKNSPEAAASDLPVRRKQSPRE